MCIIGILANQNTILEKSRFCLNNTKIGARQKPTTTASIKHFISNKVTFNGGDLKILRVTKTMQFRDFCSVLNRLIKPRAILKNI